MKSELLDEVRQSVADVFFVDESEVSAQSSPETIPAWDSIGHLNLILALEQRFGITFDPEEIPQVTTVQTLAEAIAAKQT